MTEGRQGEGELGAGGGGGRRRPEKGQRDPEAQRREKINTRSGVCLHGVTGGFVV